MFKILFNKFVKTISLLFIISQLVCLTKTFAQNSSTEWTDENKTVLTPVSDKLIAENEPKLLGIFSDGANGDLNETNESKVSQNVTDFQQLINHQNLNESQIRQFCQKMHFSVKLIKQFQAICGTSNQTDPQYKGYEQNVIKTFEADPNTDDVNNDIFPKVIHIPQRPKEVIHPHSYIAMMVSVCSDPRGKLIIYDGVKESLDKTLLFAFENNGLQWMCNHWQDVPDNFVSNTAQVTIEYVSPDGQTCDDPDCDDGHHVINDGSPEGSIFVKSKGFDVNIKYFEIPFSSSVAQQLDPNEDKDLEREMVYIPNSVVTYRLMPTDFDAKNNSALLIVIELLDIDVDAGDFVLIGPGSTPTHRELSKAQIISEKVRDKDKHIWVNANSAYIRLVTHNSMKSGTALRFHWTPPNDTLPDMKDEKLSDLIRDSSIQLCLFEHSCLTFETTFKEQFIDEMIHILNNFLYNIKKDEITSLVSSKSVLIFNTDEGIRMKTGHERSDIFCQMDLAIASPFDDQYPLVKHNTLHYIFFNGSDHRIMHSFKSPALNGLRVTDCSHESISFWKMILPIIVILIVSVLLMLMAWRYQYNNWVRIQRSENAKYTSAPIKDPKEDILYEKGGSKDNPIFVDVDDRHNTRIDSIDGKPTGDQRLLRSQTSVASEVSACSSKRLSSVKESPEFVKNLWKAPGSSRAENLYVFDNQLGDDISDRISSGITHTTRDNNNINKSNTYSRASDLIPEPMPVTGLNGTHHESLRSYPRSALRRPTLESESDLIPETNPFRRSSKVQFELPVKMNKNLTEN